MVQDDFSKTKKSNSKFSIDMHSDKQKIFTQNKQICAASMEFHISRTIRDKINFDESLFSFSGNVILANFKKVRDFTFKINKLFNPALESEKMLKSGQVNAMGLIDEIFHYVADLFRKTMNPKAFTQYIKYLEDNLGKQKVDELLNAFIDEFPPTSVYKNEISKEKYLSASETLKDGTEVSNRIVVLEEWMLLRLANINPAFSPFNFLFNETNLLKLTKAEKAWDLTKDFFKTQPIFGPNGNDLITMLQEPIVASPNSLKGQLDYIRTHWASLLGEWLLRLLAGMDMISEEEKAGWSGNFSGPPPMDAYNYDSLMNEYERFSPDKDWMPRVVLLAKTILVWLFQLSKKYDREIKTLDQIPDQELDTIAQQGFTGLWLIGLWERSYASKRIKQICGNPEAAASAYSLHDYEIAHEIGGWQALDNLRKRLWYRGIRLASDMVPNHTGMDSKWVVEKPDLFIQSHDCPFPGYSFTGENLSLDGRITVQVEDHYYSKSDCAVVFKRIDNTTGDTRYIYHGNDGTGMPWNDTAQIDFLNPEAREEVIQEILHVARNFPIIRFDAAMVLAKKHIRRLWYPEPGCGGDIASRAEHAISTNDFNLRIPNEFWREVVDRVAEELPDTLLLAEAFWMMEGYFVRTLGMHRVYNSAFMNMLKKEENKKYKDTIKNTIEFEPQILKRFVNFMNNPDEETAVAQFGKDDKYFGVCTMMVSMPGLPMFGHGQIEGFTEKYGMEYTRSYKDESPDISLIERHQRDIFPLMKKRYLFADVDNFRFYDVWDNGSINENVFAWSNMYKEERAIIFYNNVYQQASGWIKTSCKYGIKSINGEIHQVTQNLAEAINLHYSDKSYCIFREQKSGLWYIRSCKDIHEKGMFIHLNGFEYQVLIDISEVTDDETQKYKILCETLNGKGVQDIDRALKDIFLKELYAALTSFISCDFINGIAALFVPNIRKKNEKKKTISLENLLKNSKENGLNFFKTLKLFIDGNYGSNTVLDKETDYESLEPEMIYSKFETRIKTLASIAKEAQSKDDTADKEFIKYLYESILEKPYMPEILTSYIVLYSIRDVIGHKVTFRTTRRLIKLWCLDRKICDILISYNRPNNDITIPFKKMLEITRICDYPMNTKNVNISALLCGQALVNIDTSPEIIGLNKFNDVLWFNKEAMEDSIKILAILFTDLIAKKSDRQNVKTGIDLLNKACAGSEYKAENFINFLQKDLDEKEIEAFKKKIGLIKTPKKAAAKKSSKSTSKKPSKKVATKTEKPKKSTKK